MLCFTAVRFFSTGPDSGEGNPLSYPQAIKGEVFDNSGLRDSSLEFLFLDVEK